MVQQAFFAEYLKILESMHAEFVHAFEGLPDEAANWSPGEGMNSLVVLAVHAAGAERFWIGDMAVNEPFPRDRPGEFMTKGLSAGQALERLHATLAYAAAAMEKLTLDDLTTTRTSPRDGREVTVAWALLHALEHTAMHAGHAQLTRQLWDAHAARRQG